MSYEFRTSDEQPDEPLFWKVRAVEHFEADLGVDLHPAMGPVAQLFAPPKPKQGSRKYTRVLMTDQHGFPHVETLPGHWELPEFGVLAALDVPVLQLTAPQGQDGTEQALDKLAEADTLKKPGSAALAVADILDWMQASTRTRSAGVRTAYRQIADILHSQGFRVPELEDLPPVRPTVAGKRGKKGKRRDTAARQRTSDIREWAKKKGTYDISDNGRLPARVVQDYYRELEIQ